MTKKAVVLGGGGITGIAWETGLLEGLSHKGVALQTADWIQGTSAGAFVGTALSSGYSMKAYLQKLMEIDPTNDYAEVTKEVYQLWENAFVIGQTSKRLVGQQFGKIIRSHPSNVSNEKREAAIIDRLVTSEWPNNLGITAIDAETGELHIFDKSSNVPLIKAVSASGAVPGVWPHLNFLGKDWIDGGMVSPTNAEYAKDYDQIVILAPLTQKYGLIPDIFEVKKQLEEHSSVSLIVPDKSSVRSIGSNIYDSSRIEMIGEAGFQQGVKIAEQVSKLWNNE